MTTIVGIRTMSDSLLAVVRPAADGDHRSRQASRRYRSGFDGAEPLEIGGCSGNDIFREAGKRGILVRNVQAKVRSDWSGEPVRAQNVSFDEAVEADASQQDILDLIDRTDPVAEVPKLIVLRTRVKLAEFKAIPLP
jgi:hypothetical protein